MVYIKRISRRSEVTRAQYKRQQSEQAHKMLFELLTGLYGINASDGDLCKNKYGKPYLPGCERIHFRISHCDGMAAVAFGEYPVGVDVEHTRDIKPALARHICAEDEYKYLTEPNALLRLWTLKESYIKAIGRGLSFPLKNISFNLDGDMITSNVKDFKFSQYFFEEFVISLCYHKNDKTVNSGELMLCELC